MYQQAAWLAILMGTVFSAPEDAPIVSRMTVCPPGSSAAAAGPAVMPSPPRSAPAQLTQEVDRIKAQRSALAAELESVGHVLGDDADPEADQLPQLRRRLTELMVQHARQEAQKKTAPPPRPVPPPPAPATAAPATVQKSTPLSPARVMPPADAETPPPVPIVPTVPSAVTVTNSALDPLGLAQSLIQAGDFGAALAAFGLVDQKGLRPDDRLAVQYLTATCLRRLGRLAEATTLYREVANSKGDAMIVECAQWELGTVRWRQEVLADLEQLRQRRKALEGK